MTPQAHNTERYHATRRITVIGAVVNVLLAAVKLVFGWIGHSQALIADGLHSFSDLVSDGVVLIAAKHGSCHADEDHPYGHARFETAATVAVGVLLIFVALQFIFHAVESLMSPAELWQPGPLVLVITVLSIVAKEILYHYTLRVAKKLRSAMLRANAWHHRTDSISSVIVLIGVLGTMWGVVWLDALAAIVVGLMIAHIGWSLGWKGFQELVDTGLEPDKLEKIKEVIRNVPGVKELHELRSRRMGEEALVDVHILVDERISVSEGHQISETVRARLVKAVEEVSNVLVHIDPEDDAEGPLNAKLPLRDEVTRDLEACWQDLDSAAHIQQINLHYLAGKISVDVYLPLDAADDVTEARRASGEFSRLAAHLAYVREVNVRYQFFRNEN